MRKSTLKSFLLPLLILTVVFVSCKDDSYLTTPIPVKGVSFVEEFDTVTAAYARGWRYINVSAQKGTGFWNQGGLNDPNVTGFHAPIPFAPYSSKGTYPGFIAADFTSTSGGAVTISNWVVSPVTLMQNGDKVVFYTRTYLFPITGDSTDFANRLQVRINKSETLNVGSEDDPGDFSTNILDINPFYKESTSLNPDPTAYPARWTRFEATVNGLNGPTKGRFAFRYYTEEAGNAGRATLVAIDSVAFISK